MVRSKVIIFQQKNENDLWFDIEEDDDIADKTNVKLIAFSNSSAGGSSSGEKIYSDISNTNEIRAGDVS